MIDEDPDPISAGTAGDAALWGGSSAAVGMAANPFGAYQAGLLCRLRDRSGFSRSRESAGCAGSDEEAGAVTPGTPALIGLRLMRLAQLRRSAW